MTTRPSVRSLAVVSIVLCGLLAGCSDGDDNAPDPVEAPSESDPPDDGNGALDGDGDDGNGALDGDG